MRRGFVVAGTDTDVGKTVFAAALVAAIGGSYWKPVQAGSEDGGDREVVRRLSGLAPDRLLPEAYRLATPASPHRAAEIDGVEIDIDRLALPNCAGAIVVEAAGGLMVPLTRSRLQIDVMQDWALPVILVARTALGTINHSLLSIAALESRAIPVFGIAFVGQANEDSERTICEFGGVRRLGRLPIVSPLDHATLAAAFAQGFRREVFA